MYLYICIDMYTDYTYVNVRVCICASQSDIIYKNIYIDNNRTRVRLEHQ